MSDHYDMDDLRREDMAHDAHCDAVGQYHEEREAYISEMCRCTHDVKLHDVTRDGEVMCGKCDECYCSWGRRRCASCGEWSEEGDVLAEACPKCGETGEMEATR